MCSTPRSSKKYHAVEKYESERWSDNLFLSLFVTRLSRSGNENEQRRGFEEFQAAWQDRGSKSVTVSQILTWRHRFIYGSRRDWGCCSVP